MVEKDILSLFGGKGMARRRGQRKGYLFERGGAWYLQYRVDSREIGKDGKPKRDRLTVQIAPSKGPGSIGKREAARVVWDQYLSRVDQANTRPSSMHTLREFIERHWMPDVVEHLKPSTQSFYRWLARKHILPALGSAALRDLGVAKVQAFLNLKVKDGLGRTVEALKICLAGMLRHARSLEWYAGELPTDTVKIPEWNPKERRALTWDQVCVLSQALPEPVATLVVLLALTGLRIGEAMGLRLRSLNPTDQYVMTDGKLMPPMSICVRENWVMGRYQTLKTKRSVRDVPIPIWFWPLLAKLVARKGWTAPNDPVFVSSTGRPLDHHNVANRILKPTAKRLGMPWVSWHCLRHTAATLADMAGASVAENQKFLGHSSSKTTLHYTHADLEKLRTTLTDMVDPKKLLQ